MTRIEVGLTGALRGKRNLLKETANITRAVCVCVPRVVVSLSHLFITEQECGSERERERESERVFESRPKALPYCSLVLPETDGVVLVAHQLVVWPLSKPKVETLFI